jgi:diguanylate cyclase (GGDEF)-like protein
VRDTSKALAALALVDVDRFRNVNDTLDRRAGDELLKLVAQRLQLSAIGHDTVARVGANCFAVVMHDPRDAGNVALSVEQVLRDCFAKPFQLRGSDLRIAGKAGIALYPVDGEDAEALFRNAEAALKRAKASAESLLFYTPEMNTRVAEALNLESRLRTALDLDQFVLHYQPKVSQATGELTGIEALIRWNDPLNGLVPPAQFIPILEETGMIYEVGQWALLQALNDNLRWRAAKLSPVRIAVNVSPLQLRHRGFVDQVRKAVALDPLAAAGLELEITESLIMEDVNRNIISLNEIRALGVTIAIDDFGTGFSSLSYLAKLPVDTLKIDRSFVVDMTVGPEGLALVSTIISLAHALKLKVVAEGVETEEQARLLRLLNCDEMQGYLFSRPVPRDVLEARYLVPVRSSKSSH